MHKKKCNKNIKTFYESPERVTEWFNDFFLKLYLKLNIKQIIDKGSNFSS